VGDFHIIHLFEGISDISSSHTFGVKRKNLAIQISAPALIFLTNFGSKVVSLSRGIYLKEFQKYLFSESSEYSHFRSYQKAVGHFSFL